MPLAPLLAPLLVGFAIIVSGLVLFGLHQASVAWLRPLVNALTHKQPGENIIIASALAPPRLLARGVGWLFHKTRHDISRALALQLHPLTLWLGALGNLWHLVAMGEATALEGIADGFERLRSGVIAGIDALARDAIRLGHRSISLAHRIERELWHGIDRLRRDLLAEMHKLFHGIDALVRHHVIPRLRVAERDIAHVLDRALPALRRRERALARRVSRLERLLGIAALTGVVLRVLARRFPWLFCRNVNRLGRVVCGLNTNQMAGLLTLLTGALALTDIRTLARLAEDVEAEAAKEVQRLLSAF